MGGNDAHSNIGVSLRDGSGKTLLGIQLDPYETSFRLVRLHANREEQTGGWSERYVGSAGGTLLYRVRLSRRFFRGFRLRRKTQARKDPGDEIGLQQATRLRVQNASFKPDCRV